MNATDEQALSIYKKLEHWNSFVRDLDVPPELMPAFTTGRSELVALAKARPLTKEESQTLYNLIGGLLETNYALQQHAAMLEQLAKRNIESVKGLATCLQSMQLIAGFKSPAFEDDED